MTAIWSDKRGMLKTPFRELREMGIMMFLQISALAKLKIAVIMRTESFSMVAR